MILVFFWQLLEASTDATALNDTIKPTRQPTQEYWAQRIFMFLAVLHELKSYPTDEESKFDFKLFS